MNENNNNDYETTTVVPEQTNETVQPEVTTSVENATEPVETAPTEPVQPTESVEQPIQQPAPLNIPETTEKKKGSALPLILMVLLLLVIAGCLVYYFFLKDKINLPGTETTTTQASSEIKEFKYSEDDDSSHYAEKIYLQAGNLYVVPSEDSKVTVPDDAKEINGQKTVMIKENVKDVLILEFGQAGFEDVIILTTDGKTYLLGNYESYDDDEPEIKPLEVKELTNVTNVSKGYSLSANDSVEYVLLNDKNQIVYAHYFDGYVYYDKKNNIGTTVLSDGTVVELKIKDTQKNTTNNSTRVMFEATINGKAINGIPELEVYEEASTYEETELLEIPICGENGNISIGDNFCEL